MPKRPEQHVIADHAIASVRKLWSIQGAAAEEVRRDYGEDLLIQTRLGKVMDSSRIWVQVKGTAEDLSNESRKLPPVYVSSSLALRWLRTADLVVLILWDTENEIGWYSLAQSRLSESDILQRPERNVAIPMDRSNKFDLNSTDHLSWQARIRLANYLLQSNLQSWHDSESVNNGDGQHFRKQASDILNEFMVNIGIHDAQRKWTRQFTDQFTQCVKELNTEHDVEKLIGQSALLAVLRHANEFSGGCPLPITLFVQMANIITASLLPD